MDSDTVIILLATFNGEMYLRDQLDSIIAQSHQDWHLLISDDASTDNSLKIIAEYINQFKGKIILLPSHARLGSARDNFFHLLSQASGQYFMFCDQDDVWKPQKIADTLRVMKRMEASNSSEVPLLVFSDLDVVSNELSPMGHSFMEYSALKGDRVALHQLLIQNVVTGCTMMINDALRVQSLPPVDTSNILMHDWWIALVAAAFGEIAFLDAQTVLYRQHGNNSVGAKNVTSINYIVKKLFNYKSEVLGAFLATQKQASCFANAYRNKLSDCQLRLINGYSELYRLNKWNRLRYMYKNNLFKYGFSRKIAQIIWA